MPDEVIIISDTSDTETAVDYGYKSDDSDIIVVSVSSPAPEPPSSQPQSSSWGDVSGIWGQSDAEEEKNSEDELPGVDAIISASQRSGVKSSQACSSTTTTPESKKRKSFVYSSDSEGDLAVEPPTNKPAKKRKKKTEEEKAYEKAEKAAKKLAKQEETRRKKEIVAAEKAAEKVVKKAQKDANKLVSDKKTTLKDMTIELSPSLIHTTLHRSIREKMDEFKCVVTPIVETDAVVENILKRTNFDNSGMKLIRWKRHVTAMYNEQLRQWVLLDAPHTRTEGTYLIFVEGREILCQDTPVTNKFRLIREVLGPKHHIHLMLCGWKPSRKEERERVEEMLVGMQVRDGIFVEQVPNEQEAVNWIYNMTADLGIKPHKLIERSHLPFCVVASTAKVGKSEKDTMASMLAQLPRLTEPAGQAIVRDYGTINRIMEAYLKAENENSGQGPMMLADVEVNKTKKGKEASRVLNQALSSRLYQLLWGEDPKALMN